MLGASTIVVITTILCFGIMQSESAISLLGSAATWGATSTDDTFEGGDDYMYNNDADEDDRNDEHQQRFLSEEDAGAEEEVEDDEAAAYDDVDATTQSSSNFSLGISVPKYIMDATDIFFLALMLAVALVLLPCGRRVLKNRKALNSRFGIGLFSSALIMYANLSFLFSLLLSYSGEVSALRTYGYAAWVARQVSNIPRTFIYLVALLLLASPNKFFFAPKII